MRKPDNKTRMAHQIESFGKYLLLEKLASGGMAEVHLAKSTGANGVSKFLAIKKILPQYSEDPDFVKWFNEEAKIAVNLNHGNVVSIYDFGFEQRQFYLVMEYVEGKNLRQLMNELKKMGLAFSLEHIVYIVKEVAAGLDHAHRCIDGSTGKPLNIIHRDMSPQNVMVSFEGEIKVIDFGIAKTDTQDQGTKGGQLKGKYGYMSPEQADYQEVDLRTDIFSLGVVMWELLANDRLFTANSEPAILRKIRECQIPPIRKINPSIPPELEKILNKTLAKDLNLRYQSASQLHRDLNRFLNTKYPEYSSHDFGSFIKNAFASHYSENKKKLVQYSSIQNVEYDKTNVTKTITQTNTSNSRSNAETIIQSMDNQSLVGADGTDINLNSNVKVDLSKLKEDKNSKKNSFTASGFHQQTGSGISRITMKRSPFSAENFASWSMRAMMVACLIGGSYLVFDYSKDKDTRQLMRQVSSYIPHEIKDLVNEQTRSVQRPLNQAPQPQQPVTSNDFSATAVYKMTIISNPPGARVFLDNQDMMALTPYQMEAEANKIYDLKLRKEGFVQYETKIRANQNPTTFQATMMALTDPAFISIKVTNGGVNPIVEVNGQILTEKIPIEKYPVPANTAIRIFGKNPFTNLTDEVTVVVQPNQKKNVELILGRADPKRQNINTQNQKRPNPKLKR